MTTPQPTRDDLNGIRAELLSIEREIFAKPKVFSPEELAIHLTREIGFQRDQIENLCKALRFEEERGDKLAKAVSAWTRVAISLAMVVVVLAMKGMGLF